MRCRPPTLKDEDTLKLNRCPRFEVEGYPLNSPKSKSWFPTKAKEDQSTGSVQYGDKPVRETSTPSWFITGTYVIWIIKRWDGHCERVSEGTIWLPRVTELSTDGEKTSPENKVRPFSPQLGELRRSSKRAENCVTSDVPADDGDSFCGVTR